MKRFMFLSIGVLCLAIAVLIGFYVGSQSVTAQTTPEATFHTVGITDKVCLTAVLANGDVYAAQYAYSNNHLDDVRFIGNFWGNAVSADKSTWGGVKANYGK